MHLLNFDLLVVVPGALNLCSFSNFLKYLMATFGKFILALALIFVVVSNILSERKCPLTSFNNLIPFAKLILEQGDPFPPKLVKSNSFRLVIYGTLFEALILCNGFKSTNVYNVVLPKSQIQFSTIDQLLEHRYRIYSKVGFFGYHKNNLTRVLQPATMKSDVGHVIEAVSSHRIVAYSFTEIYLYNKQAYFYRKQLKRTEMKSISFYFNKSQSHLGITKILVEPLEILRPLLNVGLITLDMFQKSVWSYDF